MLIDSPLFNLNLLLKIIISQSLKNSTIMASSEDDSDLDDLNWSYKNRKQPSTADSKITKDQTSEQNFQGKVSIQITEKFDDLKKRSEAIKIQSTHHMQRIEKMRSKKLIRRAMKDPEVRELVTQNQTVAQGECSSEVKEKKDWDEIKPFLNINNRFQGVSHGALGPKNEIQSIIEDAIKEGDFEKAEILSDTLSNKEFAGKICTAFAAKRAQEQLEKQKELEKNKRMKKIRWTFEAKEKWEMKGNM